VDVQTLLKQEHVMLLCETCVFWWTDTCNLSYMKPLRVAMFTKAPQTQGLWHCSSRWQHACYQRWTAPSRQQCRIFHFVCGLRKRERYLFFLFVSYSYSILLRFTSNPLSLTQSNLALQQTSCVFHVSVECQFFIKHRNVNDDDGWSYIKISKTVTITLNKYHTEHVHQNANIS
jgi:hypothetical protein